MEVKYITKTGKILETYLFGDIVKGEIWRTYIDVYRIRHNKRCKPFKKKLFADKNGVYIVYDGEKIHLNHFKYYSAEELISNITKYQKEKDFYVFDDDIWATIMKEHDRIAFVSKLPINNPVVNYIKSKNNEEINFLCSLCERRYTKDMWSAKISLESSNACYHTFVGAKDFYFSDFCSLIKEGQIKIVIKDKYIKEYNEKQEEKKTLLYKIERFLRLIPTEEIVIV